MLWGALGGQKVGCLYRLVLLVRLVGFLDFDDSGEGWSVKCCGNIKNNDVCIDQ